MADGDSYATRETLLSKIKNKHDDASWEDFVFYYKNYIYIICRKMNVTHHDAEEVVQKVLMVAWGKLPDFNYDKNQSFRGWLFRVTRFTVLKLFRSVGRQKNIRDKACEYQSLDTFSEPDIEEIADREWRTHIANLAMKNIKDKFSEAVIDVFKKLSSGQSRSEVAEAMDLPPNTISVYKKRVSAMLCKEIRRLYHELGEI